MCLRFVLKCLVFFSDGSLLSLDDSLFSSNSFRVACQQGHEEVVRLLLIDGRSDPSDRDNGPLTGAVSNGHARVVRALLEDGRVDPSVFDYKPLRVALLKGDTEIIRLLAAVIFPEEFYRILIWCFNHALSENRVRSLKYLWINHPDGVKMLREQVAEWCLRRLEDRSLIGVERAEFLLLLFAVDIQP